jgi:hypothetical protein
MGLPTLSGVAARFYPAVLPVRTIAPAWADIDLRRARTHGGTGRRGAPRPMMEPEP